MLPKWRRLRIATAIFFILVGAGLVVLALIAPPAVSAEARGLLIILALVLPVAMTVLMTIRGWQASAAAGGTPPPMVARLLGSGGAAVVPIVIMFALLGLLYALGTALDKHG